MAYTILCDEGVTFTAAELLNIHFAQVKDRRFLEAMDRRSGDLYVLTMSPAFSDSYQAACEARDKLLSGGRAQNIFVLDTRTAFSGELAVARRLHDFLISGMEPEQALMETQAFIESLSTIGVLDRADVRREREAVSRKGTALRAGFGRRLLMEGGQDGRLHVRGRSRRSDTEELAAMAQRQFVRRKEKPKRCVITYSGCPERAKELGQRLKGSCGFRELVIVPADRAASKFMGTGTLMAAF